MKKVIALFSSLLIFSGLKAQITPTVKKETIPPALPRPAGPADSLKSLKGNMPVNVKSPGPADSLKAIKLGVIMKQTNTLPMKEMPLPVKGTTNPAAKPDKH